MKISKTLEIEARKAIKKISTSNYVVEIMQGNFFVAREDRISSGILIGFFEEGGEKFFIFQKK